MSADCLETETVLEEIEEMGWDYVGDNSPMNDDSNYEFDRVYESPEGDVRLGFNYGEEDKDIWASLETTNNCYAHRILNEGIDMNMIDQDEKVVYCKMAYGLEELRELARESYEALEDIE